MFRCPANANIVVWRPHSAQSDANQTSAHIRLFPVSAMAPSRLSEVLLSSESHLAGGIRDGTCGREQYCENGFPGQAELAAAPGECSPLSPPGELPAFLQTSLGPGEYLFVPHGFLTSVSPGPQGSVGFLSSCLVDASNVVSFSDALAVQRVLSPFLSIGSVDSAGPEMARAPPEDRPLTAYLEALLGLREVSGGDGEEPQPVRRRRGGELRAWQAGLEWALRLRRTALPRPLVLLQARGRTEAWLEVTSPFRPPPEDRTAFGLVVRLCLLAPDRPARIRAVHRALVADHQEGPGPGEGGAGGCEVRRMAWGELLPGDRGAVRLLLRALRPSSPYQAAVGLFLDRTDGPLSLFSGPFLTLPLAPPSPPGPFSPLFPGPKASLSDHGAALLDFSEPLDDGGAPVLG